jgi:hypothetical protein
MKNFTIYIIIILICIFIFLTIIYKNYIENYSCNNNFDDNNNIPEYIKKYENIDFKGYPNYKNENITQYNFNRLFVNVQKINEKKINLKNKGNYNFYTQSTTDQKLRMDLDIISKYVIMVLNDDNYYDFTKTNFGDVEIWIDKNGNEQIKYELFLWDKKNYFQIKLWVNVLKLVEGYAEKYGIKDSPYIFPDFNIGWPFKDQIIPLPTDTITTGHFDTSLDSIKPNIPSKIKYLYLNQIEIQNSTLIVDYHKNKYPFNKLTVDENGFSGITDQSLEYAILKTNAQHNPYFNNGRKYNEWPTLDNELKFYPQYPNVQPPQKWDLDGVYYYDNEYNSPNNNENSENRIKYTKLNNKYKNKYCDIYHAGTRWSEQQEPLQGQFWVSNYQLPKCGTNEWLFSNSLPVGGMGGNVFFGGGKK